ncbi:MAG TPA: phosphatidate cytidylyltransferase [Methylovirgula sp.]|nr:phosphatidate cytidylyltransferase [Methylovirgula sp.]
MMEPAEAPEPRPDDGQDAAAPDGPPASPTLAARLADLGPRVGSSTILVAVAILSLRVGGVVFVLAWLAAALVVHFEWQRIIGGARQATRLAIGSAALVTAAILVSTVSGNLAALTIGIGALAAAKATDHGRRGWAAGGVLYAGSLIISVVTLRMSFPFGPRAIAWLFAVVWGTDVVAYFAGRLIGGPKFLPQISPSKTWAGTALGVVGGALIGSLFLALAARLTRLDTPAPSFAPFLLGLATAAVAQGGDLFESWMKRRFGAKDSSNFIPGHGGLMDRLDGFIAAAVWAAVLGALRGFPSTAEGLFHWM